MHPVISSNLPLFFILFSIVPRPWHAGQFFISSKPCSLTFRVSPHKEQWISDSSDPLPFFCYLYGSHLEYSCYPLILGPTYNTLCRVKTKGRFRRCPELNQDDLNWSCTFSRRVDYHYPTSPCLLTWRRDGDSNPETLAGGSLANCWLNHWPISP